ncbi:Rv0361 family membrane protein [Nocardia jejuensis]|uniref:Rv0361 family membrane protein n=1 Tax=Nocardia jejuensis TaxID=328049 RepID=UPI0008363A43|nr:hypothetical protein [Nocardia jejuensis]
MTFPTDGQRHSASDSEQQASSEHRGSRRTGLLVGLSVLAVAVIGGGTALAVTMTGKDTPTDTQRIESSIRDFYSTLAAQGPSIAFTQACAADRAQFDALPAAQRTASDQGKVTMDVASIDQIIVTGDRATATTIGTLKLPGAQDKPTTTAEHLRDEDGTWKVCSSDAR